jgi:hypothetical protein
MASLRLVGRGANPLILDIGEPLSECQIASMAGNAPAMRNARVAGGIPRRSLQVSKSGGIVSTMIL